MREKQKGPEGLQKQPEVLKATNFYDGNINPPSSVQVGRWQQEGDLVGLLNRLK